MGFHRHIPMPDWRLLSSASSASAIRFRIAGAYRSSRCLLLLLLCLTMCLPKTSASEVTDECDWTASGKNPSLVQPAHVRCSQGVIRWSYPQGALHVVLRLGTGRRDFKGCIRASDHFRGARVFVEGRRKLHPLLSPTDGKPLQLPRCFHSHRGQAALYVEADSLGNNGEILLDKMVSEFSYHLRSVNSRDRFDPSEECRPCTVDELLQAYCSSEFVIQGQIANVQHNEEMERTELTVVTTKILHQTSGQPSDVIGSSLVAERTRDVTLHLPLKCGVTTGSGEFVFFGKYVFSSPTVHCAPRLEEWRRIRTKALRLGANQCQM